MSDVAELEKRITSALDRIAAGLGNISGQGGAPVDDAELKALTEKLESERTANAQLEERVIAIKDKQEKMVDGLKAEVARLIEEMAEQDKNIQKVKQVNRRLRKNNQALRDANEKGVGDPALINAGKDAELDALRASSNADRAELDAILAELAPLIEGGAANA